MNGAESLEVWPLVMGLFGGLALFLFGMDMMSQALKAVAGERMKSILATLTSNRITGALTGAFVTAIIQSSSVTTVMVVGFITAGLMSLSQSIGIIMGANIGTTVTAQIIAFKVTKFALLLIAAGFGMTLISRLEKLRFHGKGIMGLGLLFFGMGVMGEAMQPLRDYGPFLDWMTHMDNPVVGILAGALFTALVQSSSATTAVVIVSAGQGILSLPAGIALIFGANVGTCVTAILASIGRPREALRASIVHVLFNLAGVLLWLGFIDELARWVTAISPVSEELIGVERLSAETPRQIANAHTIFNVVNTTLFLGFSTQFARFVEWIVPDRPLVEAARVRARYLDSELIATPSLALERVRLELKIVGDHVQAMMQAILPAIVSGNELSLRAISKMDDDVDALHGQIVVYLGRISQAALTKEQTTEFLKLMEAVNDLENIGDIIETNLVALGRHRIEQNITISEATQTILQNFQHAVSESVATAVEAVTTKSEDASQAVVQMKQKINRLADEAAAHQARRLVALEPHRLPNYRIETDVLQNLKRIFYFAKRMARAAIPAMELREDD